jgi:hypothetical protein
MELAGKYSKQATVSDVIALAKSYAPGKQLAAGDPESELVARLIPAAMNLGLDPGTVVQSVVGNK